MKKLKKVWNVIRYGEMSGGTALIILGVAFVLSMIEMAILFPD